MNTMNCLRKKEVSPVAHIPIWGSNTVGNRDKIPTWFLQQAIDIATLLELDVRNVVVASKESTGLIASATALLCGTPTKALLKWFPSSVTSPSDCAL